MTTQLLTGWGRTAPTAARRADVRDVEDVVRAVRSGGPVLARGLGRSYGDAAQCAGGTVVQGRGLDHLHLDGATGLADVGAGVTLDARLRVAVPRGWFLPVTPGTRQVTVGGAIAADVHGKNHHVDGSFGAHVRDLDLVDGTGTVRRLAPDAADADDVAAFRATVGGLGLTGIVTRATVALQRVQSAWMAVETERTGDLAGTLAALRRQDRTHRYTVAWVDATAGGRRAGRGIVTGGDHAPASAVPGPLDYRPRTRAAVPAVPVRVVRPLVVRAFNEAWFRRAPAAPGVGPERLEAFFHPLDAVAGWNRLYGPHGFVQYQFVVPDDRADVVEAALGRLRSAGSAPFLVVLKRFGPAGDGLLSFPRPGWTLAVDLPVAATDRLARVLDRLDGDVAAASGAVYLVKDARCRPDLVPAMYPALDAWRAVRDRLDPDRVFRSDLSRRLAL